MAQFSERLKIALSDINMKQSVLAYRVGIDRSYISNYLSGKYNPKEETLIKMADVLGVEAAWLAGFDVPKTSESHPRRLGIEGRDRTQIGEKKPIENDELSKGLEMLIELFKQIPAESQPMVIEMIRAALKAQGLVED